MKKLVRLFVLLLVVQTAQAQSISVGAKLGVNFADQTWKGGGGYASPSIGPGFHIGGYLTAMLTDHLGVQPELLYSAQGYKNGSTTVHTNYVTIPVLARFNFNKVFSVHAGPQFGLLTSAKAKTSGNSTDVKDAFKSSDVGIAAGVCVDLPMKLNFSFRIIKGLSDISDLNDGITRKNFNIQLSVGYRLFGGD